MKSLFFRFKPSLLLAIMLLAGCAQPVVRNISAGKTESGLANIDLALKEAPGNSDNRAFLFKQREAAVDKILARADVARNKAQLDEAETGYKKALVLDADNSRAVAGIEGVQADRRSMAEAKAQPNQGDSDQHHLKPTPVVAEKPLLPAALTSQNHPEGTEAVAVTETPSALKLALRKHITLEFQDASIKEVFGVISRVAGLNFVFDKDIKPDLKVTIFVRNSSIEDAIKLLLVTNQLGQEILNENSVLIYPNTPAKNHDYQQLVVKSFYLANADVKKTLDMIKTILKTKDVFIDEKINLLVMRDTPEVIRLAEKLIAAQDLEEPEVVLEVEVLEMSKDLASNLGLQFPQQISANVTGAAGTAGSFTLQEWKNRNSKMISMQVSNPALALNLKRLDSDTTTLANPRIRVKDKQKAKIHIGQRLPVITTVVGVSGGSSETVNYIDVGLKLDVEPNIRLGNEVDMKVDLEVSSVTNKIPTSANGSVYELGTRNASTLLRLKDGETQVLAGLIQNSESSSMNKLPGLGELPLLGRLFNNDNHDKSKTELVLLITPHIVRNVTRPDAITSEFPSGTENAIGSTAMVAPVSAPVQVKPALAEVAKPVKTEVITTTEVVDAKP